MKSEYIFITYNIFLTLSILMCKHPLKLIAQITDFGIVYIAFHNIYFLNNT